MVQLCFSQARYNRHQRSSFATAHSPRSYNRLSNTYFSSYVQHISSMSSASRSLENRHSDVRSNHKFHRTHQSKKMCHLQKHCSTFFETLGATHNLTKAIVTIVLQSPIFFWTAFKPVFPRFVKFISRRFFIVVLVSEFRIEATVKVLR